MQPRREDLDLAELDFVPLEEELDDPALETAAELARLLQHVQAARYSGA